MAILEIGMVILEICKVILAIVVIYVLVMSVFDLVRWQIHDHQTEINEMLANVLEKCGKPSESDKIEYYRMLSAYHDDVAKMYLSRGRKRLIILLAVILFCYIFSLSVSTGVVFSEIYK